LKARNDTIDLEKQRREEMLKWSYDERINKWVAILDDIVIAVFESEWEVKNYIQGEKQKWGIFQKVH
jgi:hypothetical protein